MPRASMSRRARIRLCSAAGVAALLLTASTAAGGNISYTYDELGRLTKVTYPSGEEITYSYDPAGNRTLLTSNAVNQPPTAVADSIVTQQNTAKTFDPRTNDADPENDPLTITAKTNGAKGSVTINAGASLTYTPNSGATGTDSFTYTISDGTGPSTATVSVTINRSPTAVADSISTPSNVAKTFDPRSNDTDPDGNALTITAKTNGAHGSVAIVSGGAQLTYTPTSGYTGADSFTYTISDGLGGTATGNVSVTVTAAANQPPNAINDSITTNQGVASTFDPRTNDSDPEGSALTITAKTNGSKGTVVINSGTSLTYTPDAGTFGADSFTYTIADAQSATDTATVSITINRVPSAVADSTTTTKNVAKTIDPRTNDSDADGNPLTITAKTNGTNGTVAIGGGGTSVTYTPNTNFTGSDSFTYTISDGQGGSATATVSVTVNNTITDGTVLFTSSTSGSFSYIVPAGVAFVDIEGWGGGASGAFFPAMNMYFGGGGGGYFKKHIAVTQGQVISGNIAAGGGTASTTVSSPALTATTPLPLNGQSGGQGGLGGTATGGDVNTPGSSCCQTVAIEGGSAGNGGGSQTTLNANGTTPGGGGAGNTGLGANGRITITARTS